MKAIYVLICTIGAMIFGSIITSIIYSYNLSIIATASDQNQKPSFAEFSGILLGCIAIIITVFGVVLAILAVYGFSAIQDHAITAAKDAGEQHVKESLNEGGALYKLVERKLAEAAYRGTGLGESSNLEEDSEET